MKDNVYAYIKKHKQTILYFIMVSIITFPMLLHTHYNVDGFCLLGSSFQGYAPVFLNASRVFSALSYYLFEWLHIPFAQFSILSVCLANVFIALAATQLQRILTELQLHKNSNKIVIFITSLFLVFNCYVLEFYSFPECFIMCMGIYFVIVSIRYFLSYTKKGYFYSLIFAMLSIFSYQGCMSIYIPLLALFVFIKNANKHQDTMWLMYIKQAIVAFLIYGCCFIASFVFMKVYTTVSGNVSEKDGYINLIANIKYFPKLIYYSAIEMERYFQAKWYYLATMLLFIINVVMIFKKKAYSAYIYYFGILLATIVMPFVPNLFLSEGSATYVAPRMIIGYAMLFAINVVLFFMFSSSKKEISSYIVMGIVSLFSLYSVCFYHFNIKGAVLRYEKDKQHVLQIYDRIKNYEAQTGNTVDTILYAKDEFVPYFYPEVAIRNSLTYRLYAIDWGMSCALNGFQKDVYMNYVPMSEEEKNEKFPFQGDFQSHEDRHFVFEDNKLYLLLY